MAGMDDQWHRERSADWTMSTVANFPHRPSGLAAAMEREIVLPADDDCDEARQAFNLAIDQRPAAASGQSRPTTGCAASRQPSPATGREPL